MVVAPIRNVELGISLELGAWDLELLFHVFQQRPIRFDVELGIM